jgi:hypothetical protein
MCTDAYLFVLIAEPSTLKMSVYWKLTRSSKRYAESSRYVDVRKKYGRTMVLISQEQRENFDVPCSIQELNAEAIKRELYSRDVD